MYPFRFGEITRRDNLERGKDIPNRIKTLIENVSYVIFNFIRSGLFEADKISVAASMCIRILVDNGTLQELHANVIIRGRVADDVPSPGEDLYKWLSELAWARLKAIEEDLGGSDPLFEGLMEKIATDVDEWEEWYNLPNPENTELPGDYRSLEPIPRLMLLRVLRPDRLPFALTEYVKEKLGPRYVTQKPFSMEETYQHTTAQIPVLFVLYPGVDPTPWVEEWGKKKGITAESGRFVNISMGQGKEKEADAAILKLSKIGGWVFLQNVHLMTDWLTHLHEKLESLEPHPNFRMFLSAEPPADCHQYNLPEGLLEVGKLLLYMHIAMYEFQTILFRSVYVYLYAFLHICMQ